VLRPAALGLSTGATVPLVLYGVPLVLGLLLLPRAVGGQEFSWLANIPLGIIFGVGAALAVSGAVIGTLLPQILDSARPLGADIGALIGVIVLTIGTVLVLARFYYSAAPQTPAGRITLVTSGAGHWLLMIAFGFFFAGALQSYLSALTERMHFLLSFFGLAR
jgi:hypothetical protein